MQQGRITTISVLVAMIGHSLLGCCVHHSYAGDHSVNSQHYESARPSHQHDAAEHEDHDQAVGDSPSRNLASEEPDDHSHCHDGESRCRFVHSTNDQVQIPDLELSGKTPVLIQRLASCTSEKSQLGGSSFLPIASTMPVRSRAQIWRL